VSGTLRVGGELTVAASGLTRGATPLNLVINSDSPVNLAQIDSAPDGSFAVAVTLPATLPPGEHVLAVLHNGVTLATAPVTLAPKPASNLVEALGAGFSGGADARGEVTAGFAALGLLAFASVAALGLQRLRRRRPAVKGPRA
jgi:hypothetical protein